MVTGVDRDPTWIGDGRRSLMIADSELPALKMVLNFLATLSVDGVSLVSRTLLLLKFAFGADFFLGGGGGFEVELRRPSEPSGLLDGGRDRWANGEPRRPRPIASRERKSLRRRVRRHVLFSLFFVYLKGSH